MKIDAQLKEALEDIWESYKIALEEAHEEGRSLIPKVPVSSLGLARAREVVTVVQSHL